MNFFRVRKLFFSIFAIYPWLYVYRPWSRVATAALLIAANALQVSLGPRTGSP